MNPPAATGHPPPGDIPKPIRPPLWAQATPQTRLGLAFALLIGLGLFLRIWQYAFNRSLWLDEAYLATSIVSRTMGDLLTHPLANDQVAPLGFLWLVKISVLLWDDSDLALRLVPLLSGCLSVLVAWRIALLTLNHPVARLLFVGLVSSSPVLVYYSSELKQYSGDVLVAMLILWAGAAFRAERWRSGAAVLALTGALGVWLSHPAVFVLAAVGVTLWLDMAASKQHRAWAAISVVGLIWLASFALNYGVSLRALSSKSSLQDFWSYAYAPVPRGLEDLVWYWENALALVHLALRHVGVAGHLGLPDWFEPVNVALLCLTLAGVVALLRSPPRLAGFLVLSVLSVLLASLLHLYPFRSRLILFLVPVVLLTLSVLVDKALQRGHRSWTWGAIGVAVGLMAVTGSHSLPKVWQPYNHSNIKGAMAYVQGHLQASDQIAVSTWTGKAFSVYAPAYGLDGVVLRLYLDTPNVQHNAYALVRRICSGRVPGRTWIIISHRFGQRQDFLALLSSLSPALPAWEDAGAGAYLFDFSGSAYCKRYTASAPVVP